MVGLVIRSLSRLLLTKITTSQCKILFKYWKKKKRKSWNVTFSLPRLYVMLKYSNTTLPLLAHKKTSQKNKIVCAKWKLPNSGSSLWSPDLAKPWSNCWLSNSSCAFWGPTKSRSFGPFCEDLYNSKLILTHD